MEKQVSHLSTPTDDKYQGLHRGWKISHDLGSPIHALRKSLLLRLVPPGREGYRCLDIGCGTGEYIGPLIDMGYRVDGVDISPYAIAQAEKDLTAEKRPFFRGIVASLETFTPDQKFDLILCSEVLEHLEEPLALLQRMMRWIKEGGGFLITVPADPSLWSEEDVIAHHIRRYTEAQLKVLLADASLRPELFWCYGYPSLRLLLRMKKRFLGKRGITQIQVMGEKSPSQWIIRWLNRLVRGAAYLTDRHLLYHPKGIGFITLCRPQKLS